MAYTDPSTTTSTHTPAQAVYVPRQTDAEIAQQAAKTFVRAMKARVGKQREYDAKAAETLTRAKAALASAAPRLTAAELAALEAALGCLAVWEDGAQRGREAIRERRLREELAGLEEVLRAAKAAAGMRLDHFASGQSTKPLAR